MIDKQHLIETNARHIQSVMGRYGRTYYFRHDEFVGKSVFQYGEFSPEECEFIVKLAGNRTKGLVLDVGANIGCVAQAIIAAGFEVEAFEPQPAIYGLLVKNCPSIKCHNVALGSALGTAQMPSVDYSKPGNFGGIGLGMGEGVNVEVRTLDSYNFENVSLIKIDVEGFEEEVLRGAIETIRRCKPILYLEADRDEQLASLANFLTSIGYNYTEHAPPLFSPNNFFQNPKRVWDKNYVSVNWHCEPS
jgi:FkbM family methyltransferase